MLTLKTRVTDLLEVEGFSRAAVAIVAAMLLGAMAVVGYTSMFTGFFWYDDEGYMMISLRGFLDGHPLYSEVYTQYGPFYFLSRQALHELFGLPVTHDVNRFVALGEWFFAATLCGAVVCRLTRSSWLGLLAAGIAFLHLEVMVKEPGHPQGISILFTLLLLLLGTVRREGPLWRWSLVAMGTLAGAMLMTKINIGVYVLLSTLLALALTLDRIRFRWTVIVLVAAAAMALPTALMFRGFYFTSNCAYAAVVTVSVAALLLVGLHRSRQVETGWSDLAAVTLAVPTAVLAIVALTLVEGTGLVDLVDGVWTQPRAFLEELRRIAVPFPLPAPISAVIGLALSILYFRTRSSVGWRARWSDWFTWMKLLFGLVVLAIVFVDFIGNGFEPLHNSRSLRGNARTLLAYATPLAWLVMVGGCGEPGRLDRHFGRVLLGASTVVQALLPYPVDGSQVSMASVLTILTALVCVSDATLSMAHAAEGRARGLRNCKYATVLWVPLLLAFALRGHHYVDLYKEHAPLRLAGANHLQLDPRKAEAFQVLSSLLRDRADTFYTVLGINSLYFWAELDPPTQLNATAWPLLFGEAQQRKTVEALKGFKTPALVEDVRHNFFVREESSPPMGPLARYFHENFEPVGQVLHYRVYFRKDTKRGGAPLQDSRDE